MATQSCPHDLTTTIFECLHNDLIFLQQSVLTPEDSRRRCVRRPDCKHPAPAGDVLRLAVGYGVCTSGVCGPRSIFMPFPFSAACDAGCCSSCFVVPS